MMKIARLWTGKKSPTNPERKEAHLSRKNKRIILLTIKDDEHEQEILDYKKNAYETKNTDE